MRLMLLDSRNTLLVWGGYSRCRDEVNSDQQQSGTNQADAESFRSFAKSCCDGFDNRQLKGPAAVSNACRQKNHAEYGRDGTDEEITSIDGSNPGFDG
ncbi:MAG: hypothetical protein GY748_19285 [Planctomycetaceae bacterium]|nr:hypothetical protein [Planctomycetaceae bacterium]